MESGNGLDTNKDGVIDTQDAGYVDANSDGQMDGVNTTHDGDGDGIVDSKDLQ